jgi:hypothetical protein
MIDTVETRRYEEIYQLLDLWTAATWMSKLTKLRIIKYYIQGYLPVQPGCFMLLIRQHQKLVLKE